MTKENLRRKLVITTAFAGLALALWLLLILSKQGDLGETRRLPDGSTLLLADTVFTATNYNFSFGGGKLWRLVAPILPTAIRNRFTPRSGSVGWGALDGTTNLIVVTVNRFEAKDWNSSVERLQLLDEEGNYYDASWGGATSGQPGQQVRAWRLYAFPRRNKKLGLRFMAPQRDGSWTNVADFWIPNPLYAKYAQWKPEPPPNTKVDGGLAVTLREFQTRLPLSWARREGGAPVLLHKTRAVVSFADNGNESGDWRIQKLTISDVTGNRWSPYLDFGRDDFNWNWTTNGTVEFFGALWPGENAWKLQLELVRTAGFKPEQLWDVPIILPAPGIVTPLTNSWERDGMAVKLVSVASPETDHIGDFRWVAKWWGKEKNKVYSLALNVEPKSSGKRLSIVGCLDGDGREIKLLYQGSQDSEKQAVFFKPPDHAQRAQLTFAVQRSRFVEFLAQPDFTK